MGGQVAAGLFSDGAHRLAAVSSGTVDPLPADESLIIFNSDWGELLPTDTAHYGSVVLSASANWQTISFPSWGFVPYCFAAFTAIDSGSVWDVGKYYFTAAEWRAGGVSSTPVIEVFQDHIAVRYPGGTGYPAQIRLLWAVCRNNVLASVGGSRVGAGQWMTIANDMVRVSKPGKVITSTNVDDYLIKSDAGEIYTQPFKSESLSSLPLIGTLGGNNASYGKTINHSFGYVPMAWVLYTGDVPGVVLPKITIDSNSFSILTSESYAGTPPASTPINGISYAILRQRWI